MRVSLIAAMGRDRVIGCGNRLPWRLPADMRRFRALTLGKPVVMGRKTFESIGKPLPKRENIVISRVTGFDAAGCTVTDSLEAALAQCEEAPEVMIIGGEECYRQALAFADRMYLTYIDHHFCGDRYFPEFDASQWQETDRETGRPDDSNVYPFRFVTLERRRGSAR